MELSETGRHGALTTFRIEGGAAFEEHFPGTGYLHSVDGDDLVGRASKRKIRELRNWVARMNSREQHVADNAEQQPASQGKLRRILVPSGSIIPGDEIRGQIVRGLGRQFYPNTDQFSQWGIDPSYSGTVQYAYFD